MNFPSIDELLKTREPLCDELERRRVDAGMFPAIKHPLVFAVPYFPGSEALLNAQLAGKKEAAAQALSELNFSRFIWLHERPFRIDAFKEIMDSMPDAEYWSLAASIYVDSENADEMQDDWLEIFSSDRAGREAMMRPEEREFLHSLPETVTVWCGCENENDLDAFSFSVSKDVATWFARRQITLGGESACLVRGEVPREAIWAAFTRRNESEVITNPENVTNLQVVNRFAADGKVRKARRAVKEFETLASFSKPTSSAP